MITNNIELMPVKESSSHVNEKLKTNIQRLESHSINTNNLSKTLREKNAYNVSLNFDASMTRKIRVAKYISLIC